MFKKKIVILATKNYKKRFLITIFALITLVIISGMIFAHLTDNPLEGKRIIIDPGHGGIDGGASFSNLLEKHINLKISKKLQDILTSHKANVVLTRETDISLEDQYKSASSRHTRDLMARVKQINSGRHDIFISIHANRASNTGAIGPIVFYSTKNYQNVILSRCLQDSLNVHAKRALGQSSVHRPVKSNLFILRNSNIPGVLVETGFITSPAERALLQEEAYQLKLAYALYDGIKEYIKQSDKYEENKNLQIPSPDEEDSIPSNIINEVHLVQK